MLGRKGSDDINDRNKISTEVQEEKFDCDLMLEGFSCYLRYKTKEQAMGEGLGADRALYEAWYKVTRCFDKV